MNKKNAKNNSGVAQQFDPGLSKGKIEDTKPGAGDNRLAKKMKEKKNEANTDKPDTKKYPNC